MENGNERFNKTDKEMQLVSGGNGPVSTCKHPGCFEYNDRIRSHDYDFGIRGGVSGSPEDCQLCKHWGAEGPCDLD